jgi:mxaJ protein
VGDDYAPPAYALARRGITKNVTGFNLFGEYGEQNPSRRIIEAVENGNIDVAIVWGPSAGYFAKFAKVPLEIAPVAPATFFAVPFTYDISLGMRKGDEAFKQRLDGILESDAVAIHQLLSDYGVPQLP